MGELFKAKDKSIGKNIDVELEVGKQYFKSTKKKPYSVTVKDYTKSGLPVDEVGSVFRKFYSSGKAATKAFDKLKYTSDLIDFVNTAEYQDWI